MDRQIVYPGSIPLDTDLLSVQRNTMVAIGYLAQATLGRSIVADGLACLPTSPASLTISLGPGSLSTLAVIDSAAFGSLAADPTEPLVKMGVITGTTNFTLTPPSTSGQAINYLVQASLAELDTTPVVLPFYNAANPAQPYSGPANNGSAQNTQRLQRVQFQLKPSPPANTGSQVTPVVDAGWVGLYIITVNYGQGQVVASNINVYPGAPFIAFKLNTLTPGFSRMVTFTTPTTTSTSTAFSVPNGVTSIRVRLCGGGGGGGAGMSNLGGGGGGGGGFTEGIVTVSPGQVIPVIIGAGGTGAISSGQDATAGAASYFGSIMSATGGSPGASATTFASGGMPGVGAGGSLNTAGGYGSDGNAGTLIFPGNGGASFFGGGGRAANSGSTPQQNALAPGSGGGGCYGVPQNGGYGAPGIVIVEY